MIIEHSFAMVKRCEVHRGINNSVLLEQLLCGGGFTVFDGSFNNICFFPI